jgi:hypothetical protein
MFPLRRLEVTIPLGRVSNKAKNIWRAHGSVYKLCIPLF